MKALRYYGPGNVSLEDVPRPEIQAGEVLIRMRACGICGTDVKTYLRGHPKFPAGIVLGHEVTGEVLQSLAAGFYPGQRVVAAPYASCGECDLCLKGRPSLCRYLYRAYLDPGGFAEIIRIPAGIVERALLPVPEAISDSLASLTEPLACCVHGLEALHIIPDGSLLIMGDGPMGLMQAALAKSMGVGTVVLSGMIPERLSLAAQYADRVIDLDSHDLAAAAKEILPNGPDHVLVSVGSLDAAQQALNLVGKGGSINLFAGLQRDARLPADMYRFHYEEISLTGTFGFGVEHFHRALALITSGALDLSALITDQVRLNEAVLALEKASRYEGIKTVVVDDEP